MPLTAESADRFIISYKEKEEQNQLLPVLLVFLCTLVSRFVPVACLGIVPGVLSLQIPNCL